MTGMHVCGYRCAETITCQKQLLRRGPNDGAVAEFDGEVDKIQDERTCVDGVGVRVAVAVAGEEFLDVLLSGGGSVKSAVLL